MHLPDARETGRTSWPPVACSDRLMRAATNQRDHDVFLAPISNTLLINNCYKKLKLQAQFPDIHLSVSVRHAGHQFWFVFFLNYLTSLNLEPDSSSRLAKRPVSNAKRTPRGLRIEEYRITRHNILSDNILYHTFSERGKIALVQNCNSYITCTFIHMDKCSFK